MICDKIYYGFNVRCISMYRSLNGIEHMYIITARLQRMIYVVFYARHINRHMSLNMIEHMHIITTGLHMMIYEA
jgi:hypothetical protein